MRIGVLLVTVDTVLLVGCLRFLLGGHMRIVAMGASQLLFFVLPWLDKSPVKSIRYRGPYFKFALYAFALSFVVLGYLGVKSPTETDLFLFNNTVWAQIFTVVYFAFFLLMPIYTKLDKDKPVPDRVTG